MDNHFSPDYIYEVVQNILYQLKTNSRELIAWGSKGFTALEYEIDSQRYPTLRFSIRTPKVKSGGFVYIAYVPGYDTYIVQAVKVRGDKVTILGTQYDVYFDMLHDVINSLIEDPETYSQMFF